MFLGLIAEAAVVAGNGGLSSPDVDSMVPTGMLPDPDWTAPKFWLRQPGEKGDELATKSKGDGGRWTHWN